MGDGWLKVMTSRVAERVPDNLGRDNGVFSARECRQCGEEVCLREAVLSTPSPACLSVVFNIAVRAFQAMKV